MHPYLVGLFLSSYTYYPGSLLTCLQWLQSFILLCLTNFVAEMIHSGVGPSPSKTRMKRVTATDGTTDPLTGVCVFFLRPNNTKPISSSNVAEVCHAHTTLLPSLYHHVLYFMAPVHQYPLYICCSISIFTLTSVISHSWMLWLCLSVVNLLLLNMSNPTRSCTVVCWMPVIVVVCCRWSKSTSVRSWSQHCSRDKSGAPSSHSKLKASCLHWKHTSSFSRVSTHSLCCLVIGSENHIN